MKNSDIWSAGWILYEIASLRPPFEASTQLSLAMKIKEGKYARLPKIYSEELWRVITLMLFPDHEKRPSVDELLNIPQISIRLREKRMKDSFTKLKKREEEVRLKETKIVELETELLKFKEELEIKNKALEEKEILFKTMQEEILMLKNRLEIKEKEGTPPLVMTETPKPHIDRNHCLRDNKRIENSKIYQSLKQEIKELNYQWQVPLKTISIQLK